MSDELDVAEGAESAEGTPKPKRKSRLLLIVAAVVVLAVGGGGAWWMLAKPAAAPPPPTASSRGLVKFDPFVVNLSDGDGSRYLRVAVQVVVASEEEATHVSESAVLLGVARSAILELLSQQTSTVLLSSEGKTALRKTIVERVSGAFEGREVIDVLFSEFVVQY